MISTDSQRWSRFLLAALKEWQSDWSRINLDVAVACATDKAALDDIQDITEPMIRELARFHKYVFKIGNRGAIAIVLKRAQSLLIQLADKGVPPKTLQAWGHLFLQYDLKTAETDSAWYSLSNTVHSLGRPAKEKKKSFFAGLFACQKTPPKSDNFETDGKFRAGFTHLCDTLNESAQQAEEKTEFDSDAMLMDNTGELLSLYEIFGDTLFNSPGLLSETTSTDVMKFLEEYIPVSKKFIPALKTLFQYNPVSPENRNLLTEIVARLESADSLDYSSKASHFVVIHLGDKPDEPPTLVEQLEKLAASRASVQAFFELLDSEMQKAFRTAMENEKIKYSMRDWRTGIYSKALANRMDRDEFEGFKPFFEAKDRIARRAVAGILNNRLPKEVSTYIGSFLDYRDNTRLLTVNKAATEATSPTEQDYQKFIFRFR